MRALASIVLAGCALTSRSAPLELRYFAPEAPPAGASAETMAPRARLRVGRITPSAHLRYQIVRRESAVEVSPYETFRWTEQPDVYVRRSLAHALFEARPLDQALGGEAATLDVELVAFEEVHRGARRAGRVELRYQLHDERRSLARGSVSFERDAVGTGIEPVVTAIGAALEAASAELAERITAQLCPPS